jgi:hypothetical protein
MKVVLLLPFLSLVILLAACSKEKPATIDTPAADTPAASATPEAPAAPTPSPAPVDSSRFEKTVRKNFSSGIIREVKTKGGLGAIIFKEPAGDASYFSTGDRVNRIFAIESMRLFRDVPDLDALQMVIEYRKMEQQLEVTRAEAEEFYKMKFTGMSDDDWKKRFVEKYDTEGNRQFFVKTFTGKRTQL